MDENNSKSSKNKTRPISLKHNIIVQELDQELLLYDLERDKVFCLNETSLMVWNLCDGENSIEDIRRKVGSQMKTSVSEELIRLALHGLKNEKLLSNHQEIEIDFKGLSRREIIKKVGLATMTALPVISSIVSPVAAHAQSQGVCSSSTFCLCQDLSCTQFGAVALLQDACVSTSCSQTGGANCLCVGRFFCGQDNGTRFGMCGLV